jgi:hypothetical protein
VGEGVVQDLRKTQKLPQKVFDGKRSHQIFFFFFFLLNRKQPDITS